MTTRRGVIAIIAIFAAIIAGGFLTGTGAAHSSKPRAKANKVAATLAEHEKRIAALEGALADLTTPTAPADAPTPVSSTPPSPPSHIHPRPAEEPAPPTTSSPPPPPTTAAPQAPPTTAAPQPAPAAPAPSGGCSYPSGDPAGAQVIGNQRLSAGQTLENFILRSDGDHAINPPNVENTTVRNGSVYANGGDNIKLGDNSRYRNLYLVMASSGGHLDAMQGQAATGVDVDDVTIVMQNHSGVTGAILFQTLRGGGGNWNNHITFDLNCINLIGTGPYGADIRVDYKDGGSVSGRITNVNMSGTILITDRGGGGSCRIEVDSSALPHVQNKGCEIVPI